MKLAATQALYAYWNLQRRGRCAPQRHDLDPAAMRGVLPHTFMLEVDDPVGAFPIRISGTRLDAVFGRDLKGTAFMDLWNPASRDEVGMVLASVLGEARPAVVGVRAAPEGHASATFELLVLPLRHHGRTHARLLCALAPSITPTWLGLRGATQLDLSGWRMIEPGRDAATAGGKLRREQLMVIQGGRCGEPASVPTLQSRVKALMPRSADMIISTRRS